jgi:hypothetical protein
MKFIRILSTIAWIVCTGAIGLSDYFFRSTFSDAFFAFALASIIIIHLRLRPKISDALLVLAVGGLLAFADFKILHDPWVPIALLAFLGFSSFVLLGIRAIWASEGQRKLLAYGFVAALLFLSSEWMGSTFLEWTSAAHSRVLDLYLYFFDASLGFQASFALGAAFLRSAALRTAGLLFYIALAIPIALVFSALILRKTRAGVEAIAAFLITGPVGVLFYNLFPALGPVHVFTRFYPFHPLTMAQLIRLRIEPIAAQGPMNAMPSLHMAWVLLAWWYARGLSWANRIIIAAFVAFTVLATLGTGEHYLVDLVVAFPFALMIQAICSASLDWKKGPRLEAFLIGLLTTLTWLVLLRYGTRLFWTSTVVPWALVIATVVVSWLRSYGLQAVLEPEGRRGGGDVATHPKSAQAQAVGSHDAASIPSPRQS